LLHENRFVRLEEKAKEEGGEKKSYKNIIIEGIEIERKTIKKFILQQQESTPFQKISFTINRHEGIRVLRKYYS